MGDSGKYFKGMSENDLIRKAIIENFNSSRRKLNKETSEREITGYDKRASSSLCYNDSWTKPPRSSKPCLRCHGSRLNGSPLSSKYSFSSPNEPRAAVYSAGLISASFTLPRCSSGRAMNRSNCNVGSFMLMDSPSETSSSTSLAELVGSLCPKTGNGFSSDIHKPECSFGSCSILRNNKDRRDPSPSILKMRSSTPQCANYRPLSCSFDLEDDNGDDQKLKSTLSAGSTRPYSSAYDSGGGHNGKPMSNGFHSKMNGGSTLLEECCDLLSKIGDVTSAAAHKDKDAHNGDKFFPGYRRLIGKKAKKSDKDKGSKHSGSKSHGKSNGNSNGKSSSAGCHGTGKKSEEQPHCHRGTSWDTDAPKKKHTQKNGCCFDDNHKKPTVKDSISSQPSSASLGLDSVCALASDSSSSSSSSSGEGIDAYRNLCRFHDDDEDEDTIGDDFDGSESSCARLASNGEDDCFGGIHASSSSMEKKDSFDSGDNAVKTYVLKCPKKLDSSSDCCFVGDMAIDEEEEDEEDDECELICPGADDWFPVAPELQHAVARLAMKSLQAGDNVQQDLTRLKDANILPQDFCIPGEDKDHSSQSCDSSCAMCTLSSKDSVAATPSQLKLAAEKLVEHIICRASKVEAAKGGTPDLSECDKYLDELAKKLSIMIQKMSSSSLGHGSSTSGGSSSDESRGSDEEDEVSDESSASATSNSSSGNEKRKKKKKHHKNASSNNSALVAKRHLPTTIGEGRLVLECLAEQLQANMAALASGRKVAEQCGRGSLWTEIGGRRPPLRRGNANNSQGDGAPEDSARSTEKTDASKETEKGDDSENNPLERGGVHGGAEDNRADGNQDDEDEEDSDSTTSKQDADDLPPTMILELPEKEEQPQQQRKQQPQQQSKQQPQPEQQRQPKQRQLRQQQSSQSSEITPRRGSSDREVLAELELHLQHSAGLEDDPSLKTFVTDVVYGLYATVRRKLEGMLERQAAAAERRSASPSSMAPVDAQLVKNADREIRDSVLPVVVEHIAWIVRRDARQSVKPGDQEAIIRALGAEFVDTIVTNAVLKTDSRGRSRRPYTKVFVVESNDNRVLKKRHSPATVAATRKRKKQHGVPEAFGCRN